jgi:tetrahydromethanopterin S-methyltransferase subunit F
MSDKNPLDSWIVQALSIRPNNQTYSNDFLSDLDKNYSKYGYSVIGNDESRGSIYTQNRNEQGQLIWKNEHTDRLEIQKMVEDIQQKSQTIRNNVSGLAAFSIAGLGVDLSTSFNKTNPQVDWHALDKKKMQRMIAYKNLIFEKLTIPKIQSIDHSTETFSEWLISQA